MSKYCKKSSQFFKQSNSFYSTLETNSQECDILFRIEEFLAAISSSRSDTVHPVHQSKTYHGGIYCTYITKQLSAMRLRTLTIVTLSVILRINQHTSLWFTSECHYNVLYSVMQFSHIASQREERLYHKITQMILIYFFCTMYERM